MTIKAINSVNVFKKEVFKNNALEQCPCGDKRVFKAAPIRELKAALKADIFECCGNKK